MSDTTDNDVPPLGTCTAKNLEQRLYSSAMKTVNYQFINFDIFNIEC